MCEFVYVYDCPQRPAKGIEFFGTEETVSCEPPTPWQEHY